ncbi:PAS domain S-box protein [bacterium AH-315-B06]|nr:PAS domain S-box protein [bacterium AH-315-B06]
MALLRLLIADDDIDFAESLAEVLVRRGYEVRLAQDVSDAHDAVEAFEPEIALVDIRLRGESGIDLIDQFKQTRPQLPCIVMTAYADLETAIGAVRHGAYDFLRKPIDLDLLEAALGRCSVMVRLTRDKSQAEEALHAVYNKLEQRVEERTRELTDEIKERKQAEEALRESETRYRLLTESIGVIPWEAEAATFQFTYVGPQAKAILGYSVRDWYQDGFWPDHIHADDREATVASCQRSLQRKENNDFEYRMIAADGRVVWLRNIITIVVGEQGPEKFRGVLIDITRRKKAEQAREESEALFKTFRDSNPCAIDFKTAEGRYVFVNKTWSSITGISAEDAVTRDGSAFYRLEHFRESFRQHQEVVRTRKVLTLERILEMPNGERFSQTVTKFPLYNDDNRLMGVGTIATDITERVQAEEDLRIALVDAEQANQAKSEFLASMSHDLRTPLNAILGFSDILSAKHFGPISEKYQEYATDIHSSGEHLLELLDEILDLSTIEAGKKSVVKEKLSTKEIVSECMRIVEYKARSNGIDLVTVLPKYPPPLYADKRATKQILLNLLSNAVKFTPGGGKITVSVKASKKNTTLKVADTGKGISAEKLPKLTEPFTKGRLDPYLSEEGWGLGLSITRALVDLHCGKLGIKSKIGKGTTVTVTFPNGAP